MLYVATVPLGREAGYSNLGVRECQSRSRTLPIVLHRADQGSTLQTPLSGAGEEHSWRLAASQASALVIFLFYLTF